MSTFFFFSFLFWILLINMDLNRNVCFRVRISLSTERRKISSCNNRDWSAAEGEMRLRISQNHITETPLYQNETLHIKLLESVQGRAMRMRGICRGNLVSSDWGHWVCSGWRRGDWGETSLQLNFLWGEVSRQVLVTQAHGVTLGVLCSARIWAQWSWCVPSNSAHSLLLWFSLFLGSGQKELPWKIGYIFFWFSGQQKDAVSLQDGK